MAGEYIARLYDKLEQEVIADIARRVRKTDRFTETAEIQAKALREQGYSPERIQIEVMKSLNANNKYVEFVAEETRAYKQEVKQIIKDTVAQAVIDGDDLVANAGEMAWNDDMQIWKSHGIDLKKDNGLTQIQKAIRDQTEDELRNITRTSALQIGGVPILNAYHHELDLAIIKTASGAFSFQQALEDCCRRLGGGAQVVYPSGKRYSLEAAARMCMKTGLSQLAGKVTEHNLQKTKTPLVYVSAHAGARPEHALWQGKVYTYSGEPTEKYPDFFDATDYGSITGLKGVNCSHEFYPHWEGDPIPEFKEPEPRNIDGKDYTFYEATQEQRKMERSVRNMTREKAAAEAAGNTAKAEELAKRIKQTKRDYTTFSRAAGLRPKTERMQTYNTPGTKTAQTTGNRMATIHGTKWPAPGKPMSLDQYAELKKYAKTKGVDLDSKIKDFDGNPETIKNIIDDMYEVIKENTVLQNTKRNIKINMIDMLDDNDYATTSGLNITLNRNAFRDTRLLEEDYQKSVADKWFMEGTTHRAIIKHELGHIYAEQKGEDELIKAIMEEFGIKNKSDLSDFAKENLSIYSGKGKSGREIIPEVFAGIYGSPNKNAVALQIKALCDKI